MPPATTSTHLSPAELSYLHISLSSFPPIRPDARLATDFRPLNAETNVLPNTMGSAHVGLADGREAVVGIRAEVEKTKQKPHNHTAGPVEDVDMQDSDQHGQPEKGKTDWVTLSLTLPGLRDDDKDLVFLEETLREALVSSTSSLTAGQADQGRVTIQDALVINKRWHWHLYIDVLLISPPEASSTSSGSGGGSTSTTPLPLLSMAIYFALRDTRIPRLKSEGDEDPVADDDWDASTHLYSRPRPSSAKISQQTPPSIMKEGMTPPVTLLVMAVGDNIIFDPSATELAVADGVWAISVGRTGNTSIPTQGGPSQSSVKILGMRMLETPARDTMAGVPRDADPSDPKNAASQAVKSNLGAATDQIVPGVWKPRVGGVKRNVLIQVLKSVTGKDGNGVGKDILSSLDGFLTT